MNCAFNQVVIAPPRAGMSWFSCCMGLSEAEAEAEVGAVLGNEKEISVKLSVLNPVAGFELFPDGILGFFQDAAEVRLTSAQRDLARQIGLRVVQGRDGMLRDLVEAWGAEPGLAGFASAVARVMLPARADRQ